MGHLATERPLKTKNKHLNIIVNKFCTGYVRDFYEQNVSKPPPITNPVPTIKKTVAVKTIENQGIHNAKPTKNLNILFLIFL
tara:strand:+ start:19 stop:264 length:246 start_codon:yes stop_codon:yes gene_type:complete